MSRLFMLNATVALVAIAISVSTAARAGGPYDEYDDEPHVRRAVPPPPPAPAREAPIITTPLGPEVYGWVDVRPPSCGEYRYWDGDTCRDARDDPPYVGPRW
jgi:hypothetical protein